MHVRLVRWEFLLGSVKLQFKVDDLLIFLLFLDRGLLHHVKVLDGLARLEHIIVGGRFVYREIASIMSVGLFHYQ